MNLFLKLRSVPLDNNKFLISTLPEFFLVLSVFSKELFSSRLLGVDIDWFSYGFASIYFILNLKRILFLRNAFSFIFLYIIISSFLSIYIFGYGFGGFLKQIIPIFIIYSVNIVVLAKKDYKYVFELYVKFCYYSAVFGIIQYILFHTVGIRVLIGLHGRLDSIAYEPSHYSAILIPGLVYTFFQMKKYKRYFFVMLTALVLTFNLTGYITFLLVISITYVNPLYILVAGPILYYVVFGYLAEFNENFSIRINDTISVFKGEIDILNTDIEANGTTVSMFSNLNVALENVRKMNFIGSGVGGNNEAYFRLYDNTMFSYNYFYGLNAPAGHSLTIRIFSELGLVGIILYLYYIIKRILLLDSGIHKYISLACLSHFISKTFKLGAYIDYGTPFFFTILVVNYLSYKKQL